MPSRGLVARHPLNYRPHYADAEFTELRLTSLRELRVCAVGASHLQHRALSLMPIQPRFQQFPTLPSAQAFGSLVDGSTIRMMHLENVSTTFLHLFEPGAPRD